MWRYPLQGRGSDSFQIRMPDCKNHKVRKSKQSILLAVLLVVSLVVVSALAARNVAKREAPPKASTIKQLAGPAPGKAETHSEAALLPKEPPSVFYSKPGPWGRLKYFYIYLEA